MLWFKKKIPIEPVKEVNVEIPFLLQLIICLLTEPHRWKLSAGGHCLEHESGIAIWLSNSPRSDMNLYRPREIKFPDDQREMLRPLVSKVVNYAVLQNPDIMLNTDEAVVVHQVKQWADQNNLDLATII